MTSAQVHPISPTQTMTSCQVDDLLAAAHADWNPSSAPLIALLAFTGCRISELTEANTDQLVRIDGHPALRVVGKGRRNREVPLPPSVYTRLIRSLDRRGCSPDNLPARAGEGRISRPLVARLNGRPLNRSTARDIIRRLAREAGLGALAHRISPHSFRHSYATDLLRAEVPLRDVQYAMGQARSDTTERYDHAPLDMGRHPTFRRAEQLHANGHTAPDGHQAPDPVAPEPTAGAAQGNPRARRMIGGSDDSAGLPQVTA
jgi:integrase/recombinase XerD